MHIEFWYDGYHGLPCFQYGLPRLTRLPPTSFKSHFAVDNEVISIFREFVVYHGLPRLSWFNPFTTVSLLYNRLLWKAILLYVISIFREFGVYFILVPRFTTAKRIPWFTPFTTVYHRLLSKAILLYVDNEWSYKHSQRSRWVFYSGAMALFTIDYFQKPFYSKNQSYKHFHFFTEVGWYFMMDGTTRKSRYAK